MDHLEQIAKLHEHFKTESHNSMSHFVNTMTPIIVTGYQGLPILEVAKYMAKAKICEGPCLKCVHCQAVDKETSIQLKIIRPEGKFIKVDQIREIIEFLSFKREKITVVIIDQAHLMNLQAANALLKTLEEPPENCWILLTSPSIKNVLSTIRSRCLVYKAKPLNLSLLGDSKNELLQGRWDWFLRSEDILNSISEVKTWLQTFQEKHELELLGWMKGREGLLEFILYLRLLAKETLKAKHSKRQSELNSKINSVSSSASHFESNSEINSKSWLTLINQLQKFEDALNANVDSKLIEEQLLETLRSHHVFY